MTKVQQGGKAKRTRSGAAGQRSDLQGELRKFAADRPEGWNHDEWTDLLRGLNERGHNTSDPDSIGRSLEREKLSLVLERIPGLGPRRVEALLDRFGTLWSLRNADTDEIAALPSIPRGLAERVSNAVR